MAYLEGEVELMSPSGGHEVTKTSLARLLEAYAEELNIEIQGIGSWTLKRKRKKRAVEPDECYVVGESRMRTPDLAIEVEWTRGGLDKLDIYRKIGVREVWIWRKGTIEVHWLRGGKYFRIEKSRVLRRVDLRLVEELLLIESQTQAVRELRKRLRRR